MQNSSTAPHILIIGAGLGGLTLAQGLKKANIPFTIFERDATSDFRAQGYRIRINQDGAEALQKNLSPELWSLFERTCAKTEVGIASLNALDGSVIATKAGADPSRDAMLGPNAKPALGPYTVDRTTLRSLLLLGLEKHVSFGKELQKYEVTSNGVVAHFADESTAEGTLLVGADGLRSKVRKQYLPDYSLIDTDCRLIYGKTLLTPELEEKFTADAMKYMTLITDKSRGTNLVLFLEPIRFNNDPADESQGKLASVKDYVYWVLGSRQSTFSLSDTELFSLSNKDAAQLSLKLTENWAPTVRSLLELQDTNQTSRLPIYSTTPAAIVSGWAPSAHVTLLGDAIHVMSPTGGVGANTALRDAANLCQVVIEGVSVESIGRYEEQMREYAKKAVEMSYMMGAKRMFDAPPLEECKSVKF